MLHLDLVEARIDSADLLEAQIQQFAGIRVEFGLLGDGAIPAMAQAQGDPRRDDDPGPGAWLRDIDEVRVSCN